MTRYSPMDGSAEGIMWPDEEIGTNRPKLSDPQTLGISPAHAQAIWDAAALADRFKGRPGNAKAIR